MMYCSIISGGESPGDDFKELVKPYLLSALTKGIPSLFVDIKALYCDQQKQQIIEDIVGELQESLASSHPDPSFPPDMDEPPTTYLWTLYFLAQHHSFLSRPARALSLLDLALEHTPTLPELHTCKGRILKRAGDLYGAARCLESARLLDGQDRFLNTKCAKYRLRAGLIDEADEILGLFTKVSRVGLVLCPLLVRFIVSLERCYKSRSRLGGHAVIALSYREWRCSQQKRSFWLGAEKIRCRTKSL